MHLAGPTSARRTATALRSTVALKAAMAVSGLVMMAYLIVHMYGNLKVFSGRAAFDSYAYYLRSIGEPFLPYAGALWVIRVVLLLSVAVHTYAALTLWRRARGATSGHGGGRYQSRKSPRGVQRTYASFTLRWGGVVIALFVTYHLLHLTSNTIHPGGASQSPYVRVVNGFGLWWVVLGYTIALLALGLHIRHGLWSALADLGANTSLARRRHLNAAAITIATLTIVGFLIPPFSILFGWVG